MKQSAMPRGFFLAALSLLAGAIPLRAETAGEIRGRVLDEAGASLPGMTVMVESRKAGISGRGALTDAAGAFRVPALPPASDYRVKASGAGRTVVIISEVEVVAGRPTALTITLPTESALREQVKVRATPPVVNPEETSTTTRFSSEFVDSLPILGRDYQDVLVLAPGVTDVDGDGNPNIHGARDTDTLTVVDGVTTTDPLTGKMGAQLNIESIQEIEVKTTGASAEFGRAQGGTVNILTKSGGNDFAGSFKLANGVLTIPAVAFDVPGSVVRLAGTYGLSSEAIDFKGTLNMDAKISETVGGFKGKLLKVVDPLFKGENGGSEIPIRISGQRDNPSFGLDKGRIFRR